MSRRARLEEVVEDEFDDDTDLPLPSDRALKNTGTKGALLEEIRGAVDDDDSDEEEESDEAPELIPAGPPQSASGMRVAGKAQQSNPQSPDGIDYKK
jgi:signal recognition particle subunit SRP19